MFNLLLNFQPIQHSFKIYIGQLFYHWLKKQQRVNIYFALADYHMKVHFIKCTFISQSFMRKVNILGFRDGICNKKMHMLVIRCDALEIFYISSISSLYLFLSCEKPKVYESRCYVKSKRCITIILSFFSGKPWTTFCICLVEYFKENGEK